MHTNAAVDDKGRNKIIWRNPKEYLKILKAVKNDKLHPASKLIADSLIGKTKLCGCEIIDVMLDDDCHLLVLAESQHGQQILGALVNRSYSFSFEWIDTENFYDFVTISTSFGTEENAIKHEFFKEQHFTISSDFTHIHDVDQITIVPILNDDDIDGRIAQVEKWVLANKKIQEHEREIEKIKVAC